MRLEFGSLGFTSLNDTPNALGTAGQVPVVNSDGDALEFADSASDNAAGIKAKLESLSGEARLDSSAVKNLPSGGGSGVDYGADEADTTKSLKIAVEETTPSMPGTRGDVATPSTITFHPTGPNTFHYGSIDLTDPDAGGWFAMGSSTIVNTNLVHLSIRDDTTPPWSYEAVFRHSFLITKSPVSIEVRGNSYALTTWNWSSDVVSRFNTATIPTGDRVSHTDLTQSINIELVTNEQIVLTGDPTYFHDMHIR